MKFSIIYRQQTKKGATMIGPKCNQDYEGYPALSREDNKTKICPACGQREAIEAFSNFTRSKNA